MTYGKCGASPAKLTCFIHVGSGAEKFCVGMVRTMPPPSMNKILVMGMLDAGDALQGFSAIHRNAL